MPGRFTSLTFAAALLVAPVAGAQNVTLVAPNAASCLSDDFGSTADVSFSWTVTPAFADFSTIASGDSCVSGWPGGYGQMSSAFWSNGLNASGSSTDVIQLTATATDPFETVTLNSLQLGEWSRTSSLLEVRVFDLSGALLYADALPGLEGGVLVTQTFAPNITAVGGLILQYGEDPWYVGANNISFTLGSVVAVPEPASFALVLVGLGAALLATRRARQLKP